MKQSVALITLGVADLERATDFYATLGWSPVLEVEETVFFQANGVVLVLWGREKLAEDMGIDDSRDGWGGIALAHNVGSHKEVDEIVEEARRYFECLNDEGPHGAKAHETSRHRVPDLRNLSGNRPRSRVRLWALES